MFSISLCAQAVCSSSAARKTRTVRSRSSRRWTITIGFSCAALFPRPAWRIPKLPARVAPPDRRRGETARPVLPGMTSGAVEDAGEHSQTSTYEGQQRRSVLFGELHLRLLEEYGPPSVVVNEAYDIVHFSESAGRYLAFRAGEPSTNIDEGGESLVAGRVAHRALPCRAV